MRGFEEQDEYSLCGQERETAQHLPERGKTIAGTVYKRRNDNVLKALPVKWASDYYLLPEGTKWYTENWEKGQLIKSIGRKLYWIWEHKMTTNCNEKIPDLTLEDSEKKTALLVDMACPM